MKIDAGGFSERLVVSSLDANLVAVAFLRKLIDAPVADSVRLITSERS